MSNRFFRIFSIGQLIVIDGLRRHAIIGLIIFAFAGEVCGLLFFDFIPRDIGRASNDFLFSIAWVTGFIFLLIHGVKAAAWDSERNVVHTFLARPISRTEYILGVFAGLAILLLLLNLILATISWVILNLIKNSVAPIYFQNLSFYLFILSTAGLYYIQLMILSVILFFSGAIRGNFPVLLLTLAYYFICNGLPIVRESVLFETRENTNNVLNLILKWLTAIFPDFSRLDFKTLVMSAENIIPIKEYCLSFGLSTIYIVIILWFATILYQRRDLN